MATFDPDGDEFSTAVRDLASAVRGTIVTASDPGWDEARRPWDLVDQHPAFVALPADDNDVRAIVSFAGRHGLHVAPQGTGHNAGPLGSLRDTILLSMRDMRGVEVDPTLQTARVQAGTIWVEVTEATTPYSLFPLSGSSPNVGVVGFTVGGGLGWLGRKRGLASNNVNAIDVVTADGSLVRATASDHAELFWAVRGGCGNFGVVTAMEFSIFPYDGVYAGMFVWPYERRFDVIKGWYAWTRSAPEDVTTSFRILHLPPLPELPPFLSGRSVVVVDGAFAGGAEEGSTAVAGLRALAPERDTWSMMSPLALSRLHMDPEQPVPVGGSVSGLADSIDSAGLEAYAAAAIPPVLTTEIRHIGGALSRVPAGAGSLGSLSGQYAMLGGGIATESNGAELWAALDRLHDAMEPFENGHLYANLAESPVQASRFYTEDAYARLRRIRAAVDPNGIIVSNHPIPPDDLAGEAAAVGTARRSAT